MEYSKTVHTETRTGTYDTPVPGLHLQVRRHVAYGNPEFSVTLAPAKQAVDTIGLAWCQVHNAAVRGIVVLRVGDGLAALSVGHAFYTLTDAAGEQLAADFALPVREAPWARQEDT